MSLYLKYVENICFPAKFKKIKWKFQIINQIGTNHLTFIVFYARMVKNGFEDI